MSTMEDKCNKGHYIEIKEVQKNTLVRMDRVQLQYPGEPPRMKGLNYKYKKKKSRIFPPSKKRDTNLE